MEPSLSIIWFGNVNLWITDGEDSLLNEGWVSRFSVWNLLRGIHPKEDSLTNAISRLPQPLETLRAVLVSHTHYDHVLDAPNWATHEAITNDPKKIPLLGPPNLERVVKAYTPQPKVILTDPATDHTTFHGEPATGYSFGKFSVRPIPIHHSEGQSRIKRMVKKLSTGEVPEDFKLPTPGSRLKMDHTLAYHVTHAGTGKRILIYGSAGLPIQSLTEDDHADVLYLSLANFADAGEGHMWNMLSKVILASGATTLVPVHWDDLFQEPGDDPQFMGRFISNIPKALQFLERHTGPNSPNPSVTLAWPGMWEALQFKGKAGTSSI
ncbi:MAG: hypothetical protein JJU29_11255 [Verrucomicrobia bacterium]|nr:hypothetical protein [Verrucomicrobiota bacterium]MCH8512835.1 hypothetical protein [Kiritimatiellia bacterium]